MSSNRKIKKQKNKTKSITPIQFFFLFGLVNLILFFCLLPILGKTGLDWIVMENNSDFEAADYFLCILYALGGAHVYEFGVTACYSPLSYGFFYILGKMSGADILLKNVDLMSLSYKEMIQMTTKIIGMPYQIIIYAMYLILGIILYLYAIDTLNIKRREKHMLSLLVICSAPLLFGAVERGNLTLFLGAVVLIALRWKDERSKVKREAALILIAIAAGLKFYPAFLGVLYLKDKRWKEAVRLIVYGLIAVFCPFYFFGGFAGLKNLLQSLSMLTLTEPFAHRIQFFKGLITFFGFHGRWCDLLNMLFLLGMLLLVLFTKKKTRLMVYVAAVIAFYPPNGYRYMLLFFLAPLFVWLEDEGSRQSAANYLKALLYAMIFSIPVILGLLTGFRLDYGYYTLTCVEVFIYVPAWILLFSTAMSDLGQFISWAKGLGKRREK